MRAPSRTYRQAASSRCQPRSVGLACGGSHWATSPLAVAALCSIQVQIAELAVQAAVDGDRQAALHALLIDPVVNDIDAAEHILSDYLAAHAPYLPQFAP